MARRSKADMEEVIDDAERHLIRFRSATRVAPIIAKKHGVSIRQAYRWIDRVHKRWEKEADDDVEERRTRLRADYRNVLNEALYNAMNKIEVIRDDKGRPVVDGDGKPMTRTVMSVPDVVRCVRQLSKLDGVDAPEPVRTIDARVSGNVGLTDIFASVVDEVAPRKKAGK